MHLSSSHSARRGAAGFTLIEVLITLLVVSVGMLGLAKLEAAAVSESKVSRVRSLMSFQAESLASLMRANRAFWATTTSPLPGFTITADGTLTPPTAASIPPADASCKTAPSAPCSAAVLANLDLTNWGNAYKAQFPGATASITSTTTAAPTGYDIKLAWTENRVAISRATAGAGAASDAVSMILHVQP